jgi:hypothetical protein
MYLAQKETQTYLILYSLKISRLEFLQNNGIHIAVVTLTQGQRYPKNTPKQTLFLIKQNKSTMDKYTVTSDLQHLAKIHIEPLSSTYRIFSAYTFLTPEKFTDLKTIIMNSWLDNEYAVPYWEKEWLLRPLHVLSTSAVCTTMQQLFWNVPISRKYIFFFSPPGPKLPPKGQSYPRWRLYFMINTYCLHSSPHKVNGMDTEFSV